VIGAYVHRGGRAVILALWVASMLIAIAIGTNSKASEGPRSALEVEPRNDAELEFIRSIAVDVWREQVSVEFPLVAVFSERSVKRIQQRGIPHVVVVEDIDELARAEQVRLSARTKHLRGQDTGDGFFLEYRDLVEVGDFLSDLAERYATLATAKRLGSSVDGWPIRGLRISNGGKINIVLNGGQHAREWIAVMVPLCIADKLLRGEKSDPRVRKILDDVTFHIVPLVNPDGYLHSWNSDRYWRKNRRGGHGVDLNRNYSVAWGQRGSSGSKRSQTYRGESAFSEPESRAMRDLFDSETMHAHIDFHSYSQLILYPWAYKRDAPADRDKFAAIADRMSSAMFAAHGKQYKIRSGAELQYGAAGTLTDWTYGEKNAISFVVELRPQARGGGFVLPPEEIVPTCEENYAAVLELADWMIRDSQPDQNLGH